MNEENEIIEELVEEEVIAPSMIKKNANKVGGMMLLYELVMQGAAMIVVMFATIYIVGDTILAGGELDLSSVEELVSGGLGIASIIGVISAFFIVLGYRKRKGIKYDFRPRGKKMSLSVFVKALIYIMAVQMFLQVLMGALEAIANLFGGSILQSMAGTSLSDTSITLLIYGGFLAPIFEEVLVRGAVMHYFEKYGKVFAIVTSAILFGVFHANIIQGIFAALIGIVLGYIAIEYSVWWAVALHFVNNFGLSYGLTNVLELVSESIANGVEVFLYIGALILAIVLLVKNKNRIQQYRIDNPTTPGAYRNTFTSATIIIFIIINVLLGIATLMV